MTSRAYHPMSALLHLLVFEASLTALLFGLSAVKLAESKRAKLNVFWHADAYAEDKMAALGSAVAALQEAAQAQPLNNNYDMAVETLALACYAATQLARQVGALRLGFRQQPPQAHRWTLTSVTCGTHMLVLCLNSRPWALTWTLTSSCVSGMPRKYCAS